jgi:hypothetical protein
VAHAVVAIDERGRRRALDDADIRARIDVSALERSHIARKTKDAVGVRSGKVRFEHRARNRGSVGLRQSTGAKRIRHKRANRVRRNPAGRFGDGRHVGFRRGLT